LLAELDRRRAVVSERQASQLERGYASVLDASCSNAQDEINLREEIGGRTTQVDEAIRVLIMAGMSTSSLREASKLGVNMLGAALIEYCFPTLMLSLTLSGGWKLHKMWADGTSGLADLILVCVIIADKVLATLFAIYFAHTPPDVRVFAYRVLQKGGVLITIVPLTVSRLLQLCGVISAWTVKLNFWSSCLLVWLIVIPISMARIHRIAKLPWVGPAAANFLAIRGLTQGCTKDNADGLASDEDSSFESSFV